MELQIGKDAEQRIKTEGRARAKEKPRERRRRVVAAVVAAELVVVLAVV